MWLLEKYPIKRKNIIGTANPLKNDVVSTSGFISSSNEQGCGVSGFIEISLSNWACICAAFCCSGLSTTSSKNPRAFVSIVPEVVGISSI